MVLDVRPELVEPPLLAVPVEPDRVAPLAFVAGVPAC